MATAQPVTATNETPATNDETPATIASLSADDFDAVLSRLQPLDLWRCVCVCREWRAVASATHLWETVAVRSFGKWALEGPVAKWLEENGPRAAGAPTARLAVLTAGSDDGPQTWGVPTEPPPTFGQLGRVAERRDGSTFASPLLHFIGAPVPLSVVACGGYHCWALTPWGEAWAWGANAFGMLGLGDRRSRCAAEPVALPSPAVHVQCGFAFTLIQLRNAEVLSCGFNRNGRCGVPADDPSTTKSEDGDSLLLRPTPCTAAAEARAAGARRLRAMACGSGHAGFVTDDGRVRMFGRNDRRQCFPVGDAAAAADDGDDDEDFVLRVDTEDDTWRPRAVRGVPPCAVALACGPYHTLALLADGDGGGGGAVWQWGDVTQQRRQTAPHAVEGLGHVVQVTATNDASIAVDADGRAFVWGGRLALALLHGLEGLRSRPVPTTPVPIPFFAERRVRSVALGGDMALVIEANGAVWGWRLVPNHAQAVWVRESLPNDVDTFAVRPGQRVIIKDLKQRADLNDMHAVLMRHDEASGRWEVKLLGSGEGVRVKPTNLQPILEKVCGLSAACGSEHAVVLCATLPIGEDITHPRYDRACMPHLYDKKANGLAH